MQQIPHKSSPFLLSFASIAQIDSLFRDRYHNTFLISFLLLYTEKRKRKRKENDPGPTNLGH